MYLSMKKFKAIIIIFSPLYAQAYIDPVSGSVLIQGLVAGLAFFVVFFKKVKHFFNRLLKKIFTL